MALRKGASLQTNSPAFPPSAGASEPNKSIKSVCSDKLILISSFPVALAIADTKAVLPTPGLPSKRIGLLTCMARTTRMAFADVVGAWSRKSSASSSTTAGMENFPACKYSESSCTLWSSANFGTRSSPTISPNSAIQCNFSSCKCCSSSAKYAVLFVPRASMNTIAAPLTRAVVSSILSVQALMNLTQTVMSRNEITPEVALPPPNLFPKYSENSTIGLDK